MAEKKSFVVYYDWEDLIYALDDNEEVGELFKALFAFAKRGEQHEFEGALKMAFLMMSRQIARDNEKYEEICAKRAASGAKGGALRDKQNKQMLAKASKSKQKQAKQADNDTDTDNDTDNDIITVSDKPKHTRFIAPTLEEVKAYCSERKNNVDAQRFLDYYTSNGWKVGKNPMKDWKAAVRTWEKNGIEKSKDKPEGNPDASYDIKGWSNWAENFDPRKIAT